MRAVYFKVDSSNWEKYVNPDGEEFKKSSCGQIVERISSGKQFFSFEAASREALIAGKKILTIDEYKTFLPGWNWSEKDSGFFLTWGGFGCYMSAEPMYGEREYDFWSKDGKVVQLLLKEKDSFGRNAGFQKNFEITSGGIERFFQMLVKE